MQIKGTEAVGSWWSVSGRTNERMCAVVSVTSVAEAVFTVSSWAES
jgi:hypothetical protein